MDEVILLEIYPAREKPIPGIDSKWLLDQINAAEKQYCKMEELSDKLKDIETDVLVTLGAGDIDQMVAVIKTFYQ